MNMSVLHPRLAGIVRYIDERRTGPLVVTGRSEERPPRRSEKGWSVEAFDVLAETGAR